MLIFNTTYQISPGYYDEWVKWIKTEHIPYMLQSGKFTTPQLVKVMLHDETGGSSYSLQFKIGTLDELLMWQNEHGQAFESNCIKKFGTEVLFFSTVLEVVDL